MDLDGDLSFLQESKHNTRLATPNRRLLVIESAGSDLLGALSHGAGELVSDSIVDLSGCKRHGLSFRPCRAEMRHR